jgi:hypothetical protein
MDGDPTLAPHLYTTTGIVKGLILVGETTARFIKSNWSPFAVVTMFIFLRE